MRGIGTTVQYSHVDHKSRKWIAGGVSLTSSLSLRIVFCKVLQAVGHFECPRQEAPSASTDAHMILQYGPKIGQRRCLVVSFDNICIYKDHIMKGTTGR